MSFILEALRKSEGDRQRLGNVALADLPISRRHRGQPWWVFALCGLLLVNSIVLGIVLLRDKAPTSTAIVVATPSTDIAVPAAQRTAPVASAPAIITNNPLQAAAAQVSYETVPASESAINSEIAQAGASLPEGPTLVRPIDALRNEPNQGLNVNESAAAGARASQELRLDLHVFSRNANERFVLINMRRYTEGMQLPSGATVEQITPSGVVLYQNGSRYQLNR